MPAAFRCSAMRNTPIASGGSIADGANYSYTSSVSVTNPCTYTFLGGLGGYLDSGTSGTDCSTLPSGWYKNGDTIPGFGTVTELTNLPRWDNAQTLCRANSWGFNSAYHDAAAPDSGGSFGVAHEPNPGSSIVEIFEHGYCYYGCRSDVLTVGYGQIQWKVRKIKATPSVVDSSPQVNYSHWHPGFGDQYTDTDAAGQFGGGVWFAGGSEFPAGMPDFNSADRQWYRWRWWHKPATDATASDGASTLDMYRVSDGSHTTILSITGNDSYDSASRFRFFIPQNFFGNNTDGGSTPPVSATNPTSARGFVFWDDSAISHGSGSRRTIWLGDNAVFASCNQGKLAWQPWSVWTGTSRTFRINKGPFASTAGLFIHEVDDTGAVVHSQALA